MARKMIYEINLVMESDISYMSDTDIAEMDISLVEKFSENELKTNIEKTYWPSKVLSIDCTCKMKEGE